MSVSYYTRIHRLKKIIYQQPGIATFPIFKQLPLRAGFSWGKESQNMSVKNGEKEEVIQERHTIFLDKLGMPDLSHTIIIDPNIFYSSDIADISTEDLDGDAPTVIGANILFTSDSSITFAAHPGDCPCAVLYTKDTNGNSLLGLVHMGRRQIDAQLPQKAITYLKGLGIDPKTIIIGITPGILVNNYYIPVDEPLPHADKWGKYITLENHKNKEIYRLDLQGYAVQQYVSSGVSPEHIELYEIDTYEAAQQGESFSHRFATVMKDPKKDERFLIAASLS